MARHYNTKSYIVAKPAPPGWTVFHARPGTTRKEAWENACEVARVSQNEFRHNGWTCQEIYIRPPLAGEYRG